LIYPVILSGGSGSRLWPLSRAAFPKQFLPLLSERSLLQDTLTRLEGVSQIAAPVVICNHDHRFLVAEQLREIEVTPDVLLLEPTGRNTAPAIAVAALQIVARDPEALLLVLSSDQSIRDIPAFHDCIARATQAAELGKLVTFGIVPTAPETGYGYIERGNDLYGDGSTFEVARFVEKPDFTAAQQYVESGRYFWNSGMFVFPVKELVGELQKFAPELLELCREALTHATRDEDFCRLDAKSFAAAPSISIDYAVMEKTDRAAVVAADIGWSDVGSWSALWEQSDKDENGNTARGQTLLLKTRDSLVHAANGRFVATIGVENLIVADTPDALLVAHKEYSQYVKQVVEWLQANKPEHC
jgi:mannose-1-phosphate guanylyltransferase/mannose-6-phosphate isomerase